MLAEGTSIAEATRRLGVHLNTVDRWRKSDSVFAGKVLAVKDSYRRAAAYSGPMVPGSDFVLFRKAMFAHDTPPHHMLMVEALERAEPGELIAILAFPGAGKSTLLVDYVNYLLALDPNKRIVTISEGQDLARRLLGQVADRMTDVLRFPGYINTYGPFRTPLGSMQKDYVGRVTGRPWTADYFQVFKADHDEKEMSFESKGIGSKLYGGRYDKMIYDDLQSTQNLNETAKILRWLRQDALTRPGSEGGTHTMIGSRVGPGDVYETMIADQMFTRVITIPALDRWVDRDDHYALVNGKVVANPHCEARPTWSQWTLQSLAQRRHTVKEEIWTRTYMQETFVAADATFTEDLIEKAKDRARSTGDAFGTYTILSVDPALDTGVCAYVVAGCSADHLVLRDLITSRDTRRYEDIYAQIASLAARYRPNVVVVEQNNFQKGLLQDDRLLSIAAKFGFTVQSHQTGRNKHDPVMGVAMMASAFADSELRIPWAAQTDVDQYGPLMDELRLWKPTKRGSELKQDMVMAVWFAWVQWEAVRKTTLTPSNVIRRDVPSWMGSRRRGLSA